MAKRPDPALLARGKPSNSQTPAKEPAGNPANKSHFIPPSAQQSPVQHETSPEALPISHVDTSVSLVDSTVMALMRFRQGGFIRLPSDEPEEVQYFKRRGSGYY